MEAADWNERHADGARRFSRAPSPVILAEFATLIPGRALDLACGQGRHAVWLAEHGWQVAAVDFSRVALQRAQALAAQRGVSCDWLETDLRAYEPEPDRYDLVVLSYLHLPGDDRARVLRAAASALAGGGTLLLLGHDRSNHEQGYGGPSNPEVLYEADRIRAELSTLRIDICRIVERLVESPEGDHTARDLFIVARRARVSGAPAKKPKRADMWSQ